MNRVYLVGDHAAFRQVLATIFESETVLEAGPQAGSLTQVRRHAGRLDRVDVAIDDLSLPDGDGPRPRVERDRARRPGARAHREPGPRAARKGSGAGAYRALTKDVSVKKIIAEARLLGNGK